MTARAKLLSQENTIKLHIGELKETHQTDGYKVLSKAYEASLHGIKKSIKCLEEEIRLIIQHDTSIKANYELLITVPGIGHLTPFISSAATTTLPLKLAESNLPAMPVLCLLNTAVALV